MKNKILVLFIINLLFLVCPIRSVFALEHTQKEGLFSMDVPAEWHWVEYPEEVVIAYPDGQTVAMDIQLVPGHNLPLSEIKKNIKDSNDKMIKEGIQAHHGTLIDNQEFKLDGVYATRLDFDPTPQNPIHATYVSFFNKGYAFTVIYGSGDNKIYSVMDDCLATIKFR